MTVRLQEAGHAKFVAESACRAGCAARIIRTDAAG